LSNGFFWVDGRRRTADGEQQNESRLNGTPSIGAMAIAPQTTPSASQPPTHRQVCGHALRLKGGLSKIGQLSSTLIPHF